MNNLPLLLQYIVPGYITIMVFSFSLSKKVKKNNLIIFSCIVSYVLITLISLFRIKCFTKIPDNAMINSALAIILGIVIACLIAIVSQRKWFKKVTIKLFHKTLSDDIWRDVFDLENGSNLKVFLKDKDFYLIGHLKNYGEKSDSSWLALNAFAKFDKKTNKPYIEEPMYLNNNSVLVTVRFADIDFIEIFNKREEDKEKDKQKKKRNRK